LKEEAGLAYHVRDDDSVGITSAEVGQRQQQQLQWQEGAWRLSPLFSL
jgi:hypothetical protein